MASWLIPFLPRWVKSDAALVAPLRNIFPGIPWICSSSDKLGGRLVPDAGDDGLEPPLCPSDGRQEPSGRALTTSNMHSSAARQRNQTFQFGGSVETPTKYTPRPRSSIQPLQLRLPSLYYFLDWPLAEIGIDKLHMETTTNKENRVCICMYVYIKGRIRILNDGS